MTEPFSVVMSVYEKDDAMFFEDAIRSVLEQTRQPAEIVIVVDGPVRADVERVLERMKAQPLVRVIREATNQGLGASRHRAIQCAKHDIVAVMDSDDLSDSERFERQLPVIERGEADLVGSWIEEFAEVPGDLGLVRRVPSLHSQILSLGRWRQPVNHVTLVFRRDVYLRHGGYKPIRGVEDYDLLFRLLMAGVRFANVPEVLVRVRGGRAMYRRRRGWTYLQSEVRLLVRMLRAGYLNRTQFLVNVLLRCSVRILPARALAVVYQRLLRKRTSSPASTDAQSTSEQALKSRSCP